MMLVAWVIVLALTIFVHIPLGILFVFSLFNVLYCILINLKRTTSLTTFGIVSLILGLLCGTYSGLIIFAGYNVLNVLLK